MKRRTITTMDFGPDVKNDISVFKIGTSHYEIGLLRAFNQGHEQHIYLDVNAASIPALPLSKDEKDALIVKLGECVENEGILYVNGPCQEHVCFKIGFRPKSPSFCYSTINVVAYLLKHLGFEAAQAKRMLGYFGINQETQVKEGDQWMSYSQYLHLRHPLLNNSAV